MMTWLLTRGTQIALLLAFLLLLTGGVLALVDDIRTGLWSDDENGDRP